MEDDSPSDGEFKSYWAEYTVRLVLVDGRLRNIAFRDPDGHYVSVPFDVPGVAQGVSFLNNVVRRYGLLQGRTNPKGKRDHRTGKGTGG